MSGVKTALLHCTQHWHSHLADYVTSLAWSPDGTWLATASAAGDVVLQRSPAETLRLQNPNDQAINSLGFSANGEFLAAGGQFGVVIVWDVQARNTPIVLRQDYGSTWIDQLAWHPQKNILAYGVGSQIHIWEVTPSALTTVLDFQDSSVLHLAWHPQGHAIAVSGHGGIKVWQQDDGRQNDWQDSPQLMAVPGVSLYAAWSADGRYLGSGNLDRTLTVAEWENPPPWLMQGFPGKVRQLAWSSPLTQAGSPLLAAACVEGVIVWERNVKSGSKSSDDWRSRVLQHHQDRVNAIAFQPDSHLLASASQDGEIGLWQNSKALMQILKGFNAGVSCLGWHPSGEQLAAGGTSGEVKIWKVSPRAKGFG